MRKPISNQTQLLESTMPHNSNAEKALLSQLYGGSNDLETLSRDDFYIEKHKLIFDIITDLREKKRCDDIAFIDELHKRQLYGVIDESDLLDLNIYTGEAGRTEIFIKLVKDKASLRSIIKSANQLTQTALSSNDDNVDYVLEQSEKLIRELSAARCSSQFQSLRTIIKNTFHTLNSSPMGENGLVGLSTGFNKLDQLTTGFQKGDLIILGARPSMGKTAFAFQLGINIAQKGNPVAIFSLEMASESLGIRLLSYESKVNSYKIKRSIMDGKEDFLKIAQAADYLSKLPLHIDDTGGITINELKSRARKIVTEEKVKIIIIDYIQLITNMRKYENKSYELADISRALKALAKELDIPIIALSQLSRKCEERADKRPMLSDIRESGAIEQDADLIMFLYRPVVYAPDDCEWPEMTELIIGKQRNGDIGTLIFKFIKEQTSFEEWEHPEKNTRHWSERD